MRKTIKKDHVEDAKKLVCYHTEKVLNRKGYGAFSSRHEILGVIEDERRELVKAIQEKHTDDSIVHELMDLAEICIFGIASINGGGTDW